MKTKETIKLANVTMQALVLCPFLVVIEDDSHRTGANVLVVSYAGVLSEKPPIMGIAVRPERYSHGLLRKNREFTLNLPTLNLLQDLDYCGKFSGKKIDKVLVRSLELESSVKVRAPMIKNSPINLECRITRVMHLSKKGSSHDYFIADVLRMHRLKDFSLEEADLIVTTNYDYRLVGNNLGRAFKIWRK